MNIIKRIKELFTRAKSYGQICEELNDYAEENLHYGESYWIEGLYYESGQNFAIVASDGKLEKWIYIFDSSDKVIISEVVPVEITFTPMVEQEIKVKRSADGKTAKWYGVVASAVLNRNSEIDSIKLFQHFEDNYKSGSAYNTFMHLPENPYSFGTVEGVIRQNELLIGYGTLDLGTSLGRAAEKALPTGKWGFSIGFYARKADIEYLDVSGAKIPIYTKGDLVEISILPEKSAASYFTQANYKGEEKVMQKERAKEVLMDFLGDEEEAQKLLDNTENISREIKDKGLITRMDEEKNMEDVKSNEPVSIELGEDFLNLVIQAVKDSIASEISKLDGKIKEVSDVVQRMVDTKEDVVNTPSNTRKLTATYRPTQKNDEVPVKREVGNQEKYVVNVGDLIAERLASTKIK